MTVAAPQLADVGRAFADPVHATQQVFRRVLTALSHPGRVQHLPAMALQGLQAPGPQTALWSVLLTLLDADTRLWLHPAWRDPATQAWLRFHIGVQLLDAQAGAGFAAAPCQLATAALWSTLEAGSDEAPQDGATLLIEVDALSAPDAGDNSRDDKPRNDTSTLLLRGPGIAQQQALLVRGLNAEFWSARRALQAEYPRGIDLVLCCGAQLVGLPRTTQIEHRD